MAIKIQYPVRLGAETKCPNCGQALNHMGANVYVCRSGHMIEGILLVTMKPKPQQTVVATTPPEDKNDVHGEQEALTPDYDMGNERFKQ